MKKITRVYVAGPYSSDNVIGVLDNMRVGMRVSIEVLLAGFSPWVPWHDFHFQLMLREGESLSIEDYYEYSMSWLEVSDAVLLVGAWWRSKGTIAEIIRAIELNIPVFYSLDDLKAARNSTA